MGGSIEEYCNIFLAQRLYMSPVLCANIQDLEPGSCKTSRRTGLRGYFILKDLLNIAHLYIIIHVCVCLCVCVTLPFWQDNPMFMSCFLLIPGSVRAASPFADSPVLGSVCPCCVTFLLMALFRPEIRAMSVHAASPFC